MDERTCDHCGIDISGRHGRAKYCSKRCASIVQRQKSGKRCTVSECERPVLARGLCPPHYGSWYREQYGRNRDAERFPIVCVTCGAEHRSARRDGKYCSQLCRDFDKWGARTCEWPRRVRVKREPKIQTPPFREARTCAWCDGQFVATVRSQVFCTYAHKRKAQACRRRGRQYGSSSHYTWGEFSRMFLAFGRQCAYCDEVVAGQPDPDHVVPLSRGGSNSITNILPSCRSCNSDKRDLLLSEWAADRARRGLPPRRTNPNADPRWRHLTDALLAA